MTEALTARDVMSKPVVTATPNTTVRTARRMMKEACIRHLPVLDG